MKELTIEQKAKRYDEAIEELRNAFYDSNSRMCEEYREAVIRVIEPIFPELKESEDERIRKEILLYFTSQDIAHQYVNDKRRNRWIAWLEKQNSNLDNANNEYWRGYREEALRRLQELEKQAEQNSMNKNKHKFHEGDWIVFNNHHGSIYQVEKIENYEYTLRHFLGGSIHLSFSHEDMIRTWTLKDARDGDVLAEDSCTFIIKKLNQDSIAEIYCGLFDGGDFEVIGSLMFAETSTYPATKEQRDMLFLKMYKAGYEWDPERKELRELGQLEVTKMDDQEQKPAWSAEDIECIDNVIKTLHKFDYNTPRKETSEQINWLESLKQRCTCNPLWSEEDEKLLKLSLENLTELKKRFGDGYGKVGDCIYWLKSLKDRIK